MSDNVLSEVLKKKGIKDASELQGEEKETFEQWRKTLTEEPVTVDSIEGFCNYQISYLETQMKELDRSPERTERIVLLHTVYKSILGLITGPKEAKKQLIEYLRTLS